VKLACFLSRQQRRRRVIAIALRIVHAPSTRPGVFRRGVTLRWWLDSGNGALIDRRRLYKIAHQTIKVARYPQLFSILHGENFGEPILHSTAKSSLCESSRAREISAMTDKSEKRGQLIRHLEDALALADGIEDSQSGFLIERAIDEARSRQFRPAGDRAAN
jgi:hypothetical protein